MTARTLSSRMSRTFFTPGFLELVAGPVGEEHHVTLFDVELLPGAVLQHPAGADRQHLALLRLVPGAIGQHDAAGSLFRSLETPDDKPVAERFHLHDVLHYAAYTAG